MEWDWDPQEEDLRSVGVLGVYRHCFLVVRARRRIVARVALCHGLPLSVLFLANVAVAHAIFSRYVPDDDAFEAAAPAGTALAALLFLLRGSADWVAYLLFKAAYLSALLALSLASTAAVVSCVASLYSAAKYDDLYLRRGIRAFPLAWIRRLVDTFLAAFVLLLLYNGVSIAVLVLTVLLLYSHHGTLLASLLLLGGAVYLAGLVYIGVVWHLASVVSVLEDARGAAAMRKSRALLAGKLWTVAAIFAKLSGLSFAVEMAFRVVVVEDKMRLGLGDRALLGMAMAATLCAVIMVALVAQAVVYFVCKSYHREVVDKAHLSDHLGVYLGEYEPLDSSNGGGRGVQMEQLP
ncbi:uncharacterized protein LOC102710140 [Oryza brachyantha]|uniref:Uncharacterized protein n=1 Tax=Oryza brachyantha TaxID=4533 RepID=J3MP71_ORYBR|nr:uncharacterized protein LOC102710140 [Oryza brachyantha]